MAVRTLIGTKVEAKMVPALRRAAKRYKQTLSAFCAEELEMRARKCIDFENQQRADNKKKRKET